MSSKDIHVYKSVMTQKSTRKSIDIFIDRVLWQLDNPDSLCELKSSREVLIRDVKDTSDLFKKMMKSLKHIYEKLRVNEHIILKSYISYVMNLINIIDKCILILHTPSHVRMKYSKWEQALTRDIYEGMRDALKEVFYNICKEL